MTARTAEEHFAEEMHDAIEDFGKILRAYFRRMPDESLETLLLISMAVFLGADNIYQVLQVLGLPRTATYDRVKNVSVYYWRKFLQDHLCNIAIPLLQERLPKSDATKSRDGRILAVDDTVIARIATELGYVWKWWSGQLRRVADGQNVIALILVIGDIILPLDVRIVSKQGKGLPTKPEIFEEMLAAARARFEAAGIDIGELRTTGDSAYFSGRIAAFCKGGSSEEPPSDTAAATSQSDADPEGEDSVGSPSDVGDGNEAADSATLPTITGIFGGKDSYVFEIDGERRRAGLWRKEMEDRLAPGWGTDGQPVCRVRAHSDTFGDVILLFHIPKGKRAVRYLIIVGRPLRAGEALHALSFHHRIEDFWKLLKHTFKVGAMRMRDREGAHACVGIKIMTHLIVTMMRRNLKKLRRFGSVTLNKLVGLCPKFVDVRRILKERFPGIVPEIHTLEDALLV